MQLPQRQVAGIRKVGDSALDLRSDAGAGVIDGNVGVIAGSHVSDNVRLFGPNSTEAGPDRNHACCFSDRLGSVDVKICDDLLNLDRCRFFGMLDRRRSAYSVTRSFRLT
jgi:hypothetical protein